MTVTTDDGGQLSAYLPRVDLIGVGKAGWDAVHALPASALAGFRILHAPVQPEPEPHLALLVVADESVDEAAGLAKTLEAANALTVTLILSAAGIFPGSFIRCAPGGQALDPVIIGLRRLFFEPGFVGIDFMDYARLFRGPRQILFTEYRLPSGASSARAGEDLGAAVARTLSNGRGIVILLMFSFGNHFVVRMQMELGALWYVDQVLRAMEDQLLLKEFELLFTCHMEEGDGGLSIKLLFG